MFEYIRGTLQSSLPGKVVIEAHGIGYLLLVALSTYEKLPKEGDELKLYTVLSIREDAHTLFGFFSREEKELFTLLCTISGIGPKTALSVLGHLEMEHLFTAIAEGKTAILCKVPGIGKKTAERLSLELRDQVDHLRIKMALTPTSDSRKKLTSDALSALLHLGYNPQLAQKALSSLELSEKHPPSLPELIMAALKKL